MIPFYDIHTHTISIGNNIVSIYNVRAGVVENACTTLFSYGIHPYDLFAVFDEKVLDNPNLKLIGEIGLDFRFQDTVRKQIDVFSEQLDIANKVNKPLILHVVKSLPQVLGILKKKKNTLPFIVHGFRGTLKQANSIIENGGLISISPKFPLCMNELYTKYGNYILLETDETGEDIRDHYKKTAAICKTDESELSERISENIKKLQL